METMFFLHSLSQIFAFFFVLLQHFPPLEQHSNATLEVADGGHLA